MVSGPRQSPDDTRRLCKALSSELARFPRVHLGHLPTPLEPMDRLSELLGGPRLWVKRDDCTGLASGGNKTRKLEYLMADAQANGADTIITQGATQSNHARQTAAAAARLGIHRIDSLGREPDRCEVVGAELLGRWCSITWRSISFRRAAETANSTLRYRCSGPRFGAGHTREFSPLRGTARQSCCCCIPVAVGVESRFSRVLAPCEIVFHPGRTDSTSCVRIDARLQSLGHRQSIHTPISSLASVSPR